ncbi:MAG TPA: DUF2283 domain-containing protein [Gaiellaceae bacterium]|nr:DUF2283 domain-containing protein [Gaiellaceae bacterium]
MTVSLFGLEFDHVEYDERADVLYLSVGEPRPPTRAEAAPQGHQVRYDDAGRVIGLTLVNVRWLLDQGENVEVPLDLRRVDLEPALT